MKFGQKESTSLPIDPKLPNPSGLSIECVLRLKEKALETELLHGLPIWGNPSWIGKIYPHNLKVKNFLYSYSRQFPSIELNSTFYGCPKEETLKAWRDLVPSDFIFCPKLPKSISHGKDIYKTKEETQLFFNRIQTLRETLGPCFLQFPKYFEASQFSWLQSLAKLLPKEFKLSIELRHSSWFREGQAIPELLQFLLDQNLGLVITDAPSKREVLHSEVTSDHLLIRFLGQNLECSDNPRLKEWATKLQKLKSLNFPSLYFFLHQPNDDFAPELAHDFVTLLNTETEFKLKNWEIPKESEEEINHSLHLF